MSCAESSEMWLVRFWRTEDGLSIHCIAGIGYIVACVICTRTHMSSVTRHAVLIPSVDNASTLSSSLTVR